MAAFKSLSSHSLQLVFSRDFSHFRATAVRCTTSKRMSINGMSIDFVIAPNLQASLTVSY